MCESVLRQCGYEGNGARKLQMKNDMKKEKLFLPARFDWRGAVNRHQLVITIIS